MEPLPVTVIGGYLGAGKTTLVNHMLRHAAGWRLAVLVNEFGDLPIDADLIEARNDNMISIAGGCVCCSFGSDLMAALQDMAALDPRPDHVVVEASGVAIPGAIAASVALMDGHRLSGVVVLADGAQVARQMADEYIGDTILRQLQDAHLVVLTKVDRIGPEAQEEAITLLENAVPGVRVLPSVQGQVPNAVLLDLSAPDSAPRGAPHGSLDYVSLVLQPERVDARTMAAGLAAEAMGVVRAKGFLRDADGTPKLLQLAGDHWELLPDPEAHPVGVVCIGLKSRMNLDALRALAAGEG